MANVRIKDITTTASAPNDDDYLAIDGATAGTRKISAANLGGDTLTVDIKEALLQIASKVAYIDDQGQTYYDDLYDALYPPAPPAPLLSISAVYTQSGMVYDTDTLDSLKPDLVVTASYDDGTTQTVTTYTLSGTLTAGTSTITVTYSGKTTTFNVTVTHRQASGDNVWYDGAPYENLTIVANEYVRASDGTFITYAGWSRTGYVYCEGASSITFPPMPEEGTGLIQSTQFYSTNAQSGHLGKFQLSRTESVTITVPQTAKYFAISSDTSALNTCINAEIVPHA